VRRVYAECRQDYNETIDELLKWGEVVV
jgi:hypothetical protein